MAGFSPIAAVSADERPVYSMHRAFRSARAASVESLQSGSASQGDRSVPAAASLTMGADTAQLGKRQPSGFYLLSQF